MLNSDIQDTSLIAYAELIRDGKLGKQQKTILSVVRPGFNYSLQELCKLTGLQINAVSGRVHDLKKLKLLSIGDTRRCNITGKTIHPVQLAEAQADLFSKVAA
jgi:DNA-binding IclR family transcriptional regulator